MAKIKNNLESGYGAFDNTINKGLMENYPTPTSSKVLEALQERGHLTKDTFPINTEDYPTNSKILPALKESGQLTEDNTYPNKSEEKSKKDTSIERLIDKGESSFFGDSNKKKTNSELEKITGSDRDSFSQGSNNNNDKQN
jgi:hypothetical protein